MTIVIPAYSLQRTPYLLQCNEKSKIYFRKKDCWEGLLTVSGQMQSGISWKRISSAKSSIQVPEYDFAQINGESIR